MGGVAGERDDLTESRSDRLVGLTLGEKARRPPVGNVNGRREPGTPHFNPLSLCGNSGSPPPTRSQRDHVGPGYFMVETPRLLSECGKHKMFMVFMLIVELINRP